MKPTNRRTFLKRTAGAAAVASVTGPATKVLGANQKIRTACIGVHGQGASHIANHVRLAKQGIVDLAAVCDVDELVLHSRAGLIQGTLNKAPKKYTDMRKLLEDKSIDTVAFATPNHWHALGTIWACQAGKDVYVEKPCAWCVREGRKMVEAARKYKRIVQVGTQKRSSAGRRKAIAQLHAGVIGDVYMARALCYKRRDSIGYRRTEKPPKNIHFDLWLGPAPEQPFHRNLVHYNWHWFWDFGNGDVGNQGIHEMDIARWGLCKQLHAEAKPEDVVPVKAASMGGRYGYEDQGQTPNTQVIQLTYADGRMLVFEVRGRWTNSEQGQKVGNLFYGSEGFMAGTSASFGYGGKAYGGKSESEITLPEVGGLGPDEHHDNFFKAVLSRKVEDLNADILEGHYSAIGFQIGNIAYRLGRTLTFDPKTERFVGDGAKEANPYLTREYRKGFEVPEQV